MDVIKGFYDFLRLAIVFLEPLFSILAWLIGQGYRLGVPLVQWFRVRIIGQAPPRRNGRVKSSDLTPGRFLGQGCSGIIYETTWSRERHGMPLLARKAFPAVPAVVFEKEAARLVDLDHPNIVKTLGWTVDRRSCSLITEHVKHDLFSVVEKRKEAMEMAAEVAVDSMRVYGRPSVSFPLRDAVGIMLQIALGMKYLHDNNLAHGDLKPNNVLVDSETGSMLVKVADFGMTETKKRSTALVSHRARCLQILKWKAPELFESLLGSSNDDLDNMWTETFPHSAVLESAGSEMQDADMYSFALTCSYILGALPCSSNLGLLELRKEIICGARPHLPNECPKTLESLILDCWSKDPSRRPRFKDMCAVLSKIHGDLREGRFVRDYGFSNVPQFPRFGDNDSALENQKTKWRLDQRKEFEKLKGHSVIGHFFSDFNESKLELEKIIAESDEADILEGEWRERDGRFYTRAFKIFKKGYKLGEFPISLFQFFTSNATVANLSTSRVLRPLGATLFKDGRFALVMEGYWGNLRRLIRSSTSRTDHLDPLISSWRLLRFFPNTKKKPPFREEVAIEIMLQIAEGMAELHKSGIIHGDIKPASVLVRDGEKCNVEGNQGSISCVLTDYELPNMVVGTRFWKAPEILDALKRKKLRESDFTPSADVYSYGTTCYEILTGRIPFEDFTISDYDLVLFGIRPELPSSVHPLLRDLVARCWYANPLQRPSSQEIVALLKKLRVIQ